MVEEQEDEAAEITHEQYEDMEKALSGQRIAFFWTPSTVLLHRAGKSRMLDMLIEQFALQAEAHAQVMESKTHRITIDELTPSVARVDKHEAQWKREMRNVRRRR
jgi:hypothetical protein